MQIKIIEFVNEMDAWEWDSVYTADHSSKEIIKDYLEANGYEDEKITKLYGRYIGVSDVCRVYETFLITKQ